MDTRSKKNEILELKHYLREYIGFYFKEKRCVELIEEILIMNSHSIIDNSVAISMIRNIISTDMRKYSDMDEILNKIE